MSAEPVDADDGLTAVERSRLSPVAVAILDGRPFPPRHSPLAGGKLAAEALTVLAEHAACSDVDPATSDAMTDAEQQAAGRPLAQHYCARCPVAYGCLAVGRATSAYGLWGGVVLAEGRVAAKGEAGRQWPALPTSGTEVEVGDVFVAPAEPVVVPPRPAHVGDGQGARDTRRALVVGAVLELLARQPYWSGTTSDLLAELRPALPGGALSASPVVMSRALGGRLGTALAAAGVRLDRPTSPRGQTVVVLAVDEAPSGPSEKVEPVLEVQPTRRRERAQQRATT